ncbi:MAG: CTP-dependent riboflavin kinase [Candidatus Heimdallarchaeota archaeon]|nr:CTP-dependent riboflavin kinase [Candidatus Heimdallarchaeota archaeon]
MGKGKHFLSLQPYNKIFTDLLDKYPFLGTLNIELEDNDLEKLNHLWSSGIIFDDVKDGDTSLGAIITLPVYIKSKNAPLNENQYIKGIIVKPLLSTHNTNIIEIVSHLNLRVSLGLSDDSLLEFKVQIE